MNRFKIEESFAIDPDMFVFAGSMLEGQAGRGVKFAVPEAGHRLEFVVRSVEFVRKVGGRELVALTVKNAAPCYLPSLGVGWTAELREA